MSKEAIDRRIVRTKKMIRDSLIELIMEKGFNAITVKDLTSKADINRGTFYLHYQDKYDLLEQCENEIIHEIEQIGKAIHHLNPKETYNQSFREEPFPFAIKLFEYFRDHADFIKVILGSQANPSFQLKLKKVLKLNMLQHIEKKINKEELMIPVEFLPAYVISAYIGVIQHWLENGMEHTPREMSLILAKLTILGPGYVTGMKEDRFK